MRLHKAIKVLIKTKCLYKCLLLCFNFCEVYIIDLCKCKGVEILEGHMIADHVHLLLSIPPKQNISSFMGDLKGKSSMMIFKDHGNLRYKFGNSNFWATGYYVSTVGLNEAIIRKYIREQEKEDILEDKLTKREYNNPFKGLIK